MWLVITDYLNQRLMENNMRYFSEDFYVPIFIIIFMFVVIAITMGLAEHHNNLDEIRYQTPECKKDKLASSSNDIELWVHDHCRPRSERIYYSKKSTAWQSEECHLVGKIRRCKNISHETLNEE